MNKTLSGSEGSPWSRWLGCTAHHPSSSPFRYNPRFFYFSDNFNKYGFFSFSPSGHCVCQRRLCGSHHWGNWNGTRAQHEGPLKWTPFFGGFNNFFSSPGCAGHWEPPGNRRHKSNLSEGIRQLCHLQQQLDGGKLRFRCLCPGLHQCFPLIKSMLFIPVVFFDIIGRVDCLRETAGQHGRGPWWPGRGAAVLASESLTSFSERGRPDRTPPVRFPLSASLSQKHGTHISPLPSPQRSNPSADGVEAYEIYGVCIAEAEVDILTGEKSVRRVDLMEDTGTSISPLVDLGQIEGGFVMGLGWWLTEEITYDPDTGALLNFDTWVQ